MNQDNNLKIIISQISTQEIIKKQLIWRLQKKRMIEKFDIT